jgi:hypothetical protein
MRLASGPARVDRNIAYASQAIIANRERTFRRHVETIAAYLEAGAGVDDASTSTSALCYPIPVTRSRTRLDVDQYEAWIADTLVRQLLPCGE